MKDRYVTLPVKESTKKRLSELRRYRRETWDDLLTRLCLPTKNGEEHE